MNRARLATLVGLATLSRRATMAAAVSTAVGGPRLRGVVFDMDGTLTVPNLDFGEMYRRAGVPDGDDILSERWRSDPTAAAVVEVMEEEGRRTLKMMPGAAELAAWLHAHQVPMAMVTRNSATTVAHFHARVWPAGLPPLAPAISRDDEHPAKPDPAALQAIADCWGVALGPELIMVGDSPSHDVASGKAAGVRTVLLDTGRRHQEGGSTNDPDMCVDNLARLARQLWLTCELDSPLSVLEIHGKPKPEPRSAAAVAAAQGDTVALAAMPADELAAVCPENGNTPLIFAADAGHLPAVRGLLSAGVPKDVRGYWGATAVSRAARGGHLEVLETLLLAGADPDVCNDKLQYPLHFAAFKQKRGAVELLLSHRANTLVLDRKGRTPAEDTADEEICALIRAAQEKQIEKQREL